MTDSTFDAATAATAAAPANVKALANAMPAVGRGARWFWWIAAFTGVNTVMIMGQSNTHFVVGLALTRLAHTSLAYGAAQAVDALMVAAFFLAGLKAKDGSTAAFVLGALAYALDALVYVSYADWMPVAIHGVALFYIASGFIALQRGKKAAGL